MPGKQPWAATVPPAWAWALRLQIFGAEFLRVNLVGSILPRSWKFSGIRLDKKDLEQGAGQNDITHKIMLRTKKCVAQNKISHKIISRTQ